MQALWDNPMGTDGFEFVEYTAPDVAELWQEAGLLHARLGNMRDIVLWADRVAALDAEYEPFATQLRGLAKGYQSKAILLLVERHLDARPAP